MNRDIGGPRSVVAHFRDPTERVPPFPVHGPNASAKRTKGGFHEGRGCA
jgi:hypothetical protein